jgi:mRNA interferase RelE/StbE
MYSIKIRKQAKRKLLSLRTSDRVRLTTAIMRLGNNPDDLTLDVKRLISKSYWRLRVGSWRVIYDRDDVLKIISIEKIKPRGDAYK